MRLAAAGLAQEQQRAALLDEAQGGQVLHQLAVDGGLEVEVEVLDAAPVGEAGEAQPGGQAPVGGGRRLLGHDPPQVLDVRPLPLGRLLGQGGEALGGPGQLQVVQVALELLVGARGHHGSVP